MVVVVVDFDHGFHGFGGFGDGGKVKEEGLWRLCFVCYCVVFNFSERRVTMTVLCLWLWLRGGRGKLVVAGLWVCLFVCLFVCFFFFFFFFFFFVSLLQQFVVVASGAMVEVVVAIVL